MLAGDNIFMGNHKTVIDLISELQSFLNYIFHFAHFEIDTFSLSLSLSYFPFFAIFFEFMQIFAIRCCALCL